MLMRKAKPRPPSVIQLLKEDHEYVKKSYRYFEKIDHEDRAAVQALVGEVCKALEVHARVEEDIVYPALRRALADGELLEEAEIEHESAKALIRRLKRMKPSDRAYIPTFTVLCEYVLHHVKEEEGEMFPKAQRSRVNLRALGRKVMDRKLKLLTRA
jgi:hypothetical protein